MGRARVEDRFWSRVNRSGDGCWEWTAGRNQRGYGQFRFRGRQEGSHRVAWMLATGRVLDVQDQVCHHCDNPPCCRPDHLFVGSVADNAADKVAKGRSRAPRRLGSMRERSPGVWQLRAHLSGGQYASETFRGNRSEAAKALNRLVLAADERRAPKPTRQTVGALLEEWWETKAWASVGGRRQARDDLDRYLIPHLGGIVLAKLTERQIAALYRGLRTPGPGCLARSGRPMGPATVRRLHVNLHAALNWGVRKGRIGRNPASIVDVPAAPPTKVRGPDTADLQRLVRLAAAGDDVDFAVFVRVMVATGRRREDVLGLTAADLRTDEGAVVFDKRAVLAGRGGGVVIEALDKNARTSRVDVDTETMRQLTDLVRRRREAALALGTSLPKRAHLFTHDPLGAEPWRPDSTSRAFRRLRDAAGLPDVTLHSLRHAHITELLENGLDVEAVAKRVGDDPATVYAVYAHARRTSDRRAASIIGNVLDGGGTGGAASNTG